MVASLRHEDVKNRDFASAGAAIAAFQDGGDVLRVHNPLVADAVLTAYELMRSGPVEDCAFVASLVSEAEGVEDDVRSYCS